MAQLVAELAQVAAEPSRAGVATEQIPTTFQIANRLIDQLSRFDKLPAGPPSGPAGCFSDPVAAELLELAQVAAELSPAGRRPA